MGFGAPDVDPGAVPGLADDRSGEGEAGVNELSLITLPFDIFSAASVFGIPS
jgi:hypothetical protein